MAGDDELLAKWLSNLEYGCAPFMSSTVRSVHKGCGFESGQIFSGVADSERVSLFFVPRDSQLAHIQFGLAAGGLGVWHLYENPTVTSSGTSVPVKNLNRHFKNRESTWLIYQNPTIGDFGDRLRSGIIPGSADAIPVAALAAGTVRSEAERVLCTDDSYLLIIQNRSCSSVLVGMACEWCEMPVSGL